MRNLKLFTPFVMIILLASCKTEQWAAKSIAVIHQKFPQMEAENCRDRFPIVSDSTSTTDTTFKPGSNAEYQSAIDSLRNELSKIIPPLAPNDTCREKVQPYIDKITALQAAYNYLVSKPIPHDTLYVWTTNTVTKENTAALAAEKIADDKDITELNRASASNKDRLTIIIIIGVLLLVSIGGNIYQFKSKKSI